jgi:phage I-like protein
MDDGMYAKIDWTKEGSDLLTSKTYRFFSPEFATHYVDPEHSYELDNVLIGGGLVNRPMFKELGAIVANEDGTVKNLTKDNSHVMIFTDQVTDKPLTMNKDLILAKAEADRTEEEKTFLASEQKKETDAKAAVVVTADDKKVTPANDAAISGKEKQIVITADEKARYDSIVSEFHKSNVTKEVEALQFSEDKKGVRITPAQIPALVEH